MPKMKTATASSPYNDIMDKPHDYYVLFAGLLGLLLCVLLAKPKKATEAILAFLCGLSSCLVIGPAVAEVLTSWSAYSYLAWLKATPDTSLYTGIIWLSGLLGFQIVLAFKSDFLNFLRNQAKKRLLKIPEDEE